jgi:hypothetical protein
LYCSESVIAMNKYERSDVDATCNTIGRNLYEIFVMIFEGKTQLERTKCKRKDNITMDLKEVTYLCVFLDWICLSQDRKR